MFASAIVKRGRSSLHKVSKKFYSEGQEPYVFINKHTKVICQGMTGNHVSHFRFQQRIFQDLFLSFFDHNL